MGWAIIGIGIACIINSITIVIIVKWVGRQQLRNERYEYAFTLVDERLRKASK